MLMASMLALFVVEDVEDGTDGDGEVSGSGGLDYAFLIRRTRVAYDSPFKLTYCAYTFATRTIIRPHIRHVLVKTPYPIQATGQGFHFTTVRPENIW